MDGRLDPLQELALCEIDICLDCDSRTLRLRLLRKLYLYLKSTIDR
jgi:hypothetical protein